MVEVPNAIATQSGRTYQIYRATDGNFSIAAKAVEKANMNDLNDLENGIFFSSWYMVDSPSKALWRFGRKVAHYCDDKSSHVVSCSYQVSVALMTLTLNYPHGTPFIRRSEARLPSTCTGMARQLMPMARQHCQLQESTDYRHLRL